MRVVVAGGDTIDVLPEGQRIRHRQHPELTGYIKHYEWNRPPGDREHPAGLLSPIPYYIGWDDSGAAHRLLGFLFIYPHPDSIEPIP